MRQESPFTPGSPVPYEFFVGRQDEVKEILTSARRAASGRQQNVFLVGERGIGKSSLASYVRDLAVKQYDFLAVQVFLGQVTSLEELVRRVFERIANEANARRWFEKIADLFGGRIQQVSLFAVSLAFNAPKSELPHLVRDFPEAINKINEKIRDEVSGILIILDDINGICKTGDFANWYKSCVDHISVHYKAFPVLIMPVAIPEIRFKLSQQQPSLMRVFKVVEIEGLSDDEVRAFFTRALESVAVKASSKAMEMMVSYSGGLPIVMQEIGDAVFTANEDDVIDEKDTVKGLLSAAETIGQKYLEPRVYQAIRSQRYRSILRKLGSLGPLAHFKKAEIQSKLNIDEKKVLHNFLRRLRELGVVVQDKERGRGWYKFTSPLYPLYISMEGIRYRDKHPRKRV